jgi:hypothetical protein
MPKNRPPRPGPKVPHRVVNMTAIAVVDAQVPIDGAKGAAT